MRTHLFPQLPRVWSSDRQRSIILGAAGLAFLVAFVAYSGLTSSQAPQTAPVSSEEKTKFAPTAVEAPAPLPLSPAATVLASQAPAAPPSPELDPALPGPLPGGEAKPPQPMAGKPGPPATPTPASASTSDHAPTPPSPASPEPDPAPLAAPYKPYWVVVESHQIKAAAEKAQAKYAKADQPMQVWEVGLPKKGRWYRFCLGRFNDMAQAQAQVQAWKKQGLSPDPFVARMP